MSNPYADTALEYHKAGWAGPLPFPYKDKFPPPTGFTGRRADYPDSQQIEKWRTQKKRQNIGLRCADVDESYQVIGIDVDHYTKGDRTKRGFDQLTELEKRYGPLPDTWTATARIDGKSGIRFFRVPCELVFPGEADEDIEIIQKRHRYAMVYPSVHPEGQTYWWYAPGDKPTKQNQLKWNRKIPDPRAFPLLPESWIDFLTKHRTLVDDNEPIDLDSSVDEIFEWAAESFYGDEYDAPCGLMERHLQDHVKKVQNSSTFHILLTNAHMNLLKLALEGHHGWQQTLDEYEQAYKDAVIAHDGGQSGRSYDEMRGEIFRSRVGALRKIKGSGVPVAPSCQIVGCAGEKNLSGDFQKDVEYELYRLEVRNEAKRQFQSRDTPPFFRQSVSLSELRDQPANETPMRIHGLMADKSLVLFAAPYKAGKTTAVDNLIRSLVDGDKFLNAFTVHKPARRLVLIDTEMSQDMVRDWLIKQDIKNTDAVVDVICLRGEVGTFDILNEQRRAEWAAHLRALHCDYLILDCLSPVLEALGLDENHDAGKFLIAFRALLTEAGIDGDAAIIHHMGHSNERARGDSKLPGGADAIWKLIRENDCSYFSARGRDVEVPEGTLKFNKENSHLTFIAGGRADLKKQTRVDKSQQERQRKVGLAHTNILKLLKPVGNAGMSGNQIETTIMAMKIPGITQRAIREALKDGAETGELAPWDGNKGAKMYAIGEVLTDDD